MMFYLLFCCCCYEVIRLAGRVTSPPGAVRSIVVNVSVGLSVLKNISVTTQSNFTKNFVRVDCIDGQSPVIGAVRRWFHLTRNV